MPKRKNIPYDLYGHVGNPGPDLTDNLGDMDFDFDICFDQLYFLYLLDPIFLDFQIPGFPDSRLSSSYVCPGW